MSVRLDSHESFDKTVVEEEMSLLDNTIENHPPTLIVTSPSCLENSDVEVFIDENRKHKPNQEPYERESDLESCWSSTSNRQSGMSRINTTMRYKQKNNKKNFLYNFYRTENREVIQIIPRWQSILLNIFVLTLIIIIVFTLLSLPMFVGKAEKSESEMMKILNSSVSVDFDSL